MAKVSPIQQSFTLGEITPLLAARSDFEKYPTGLALCENYAVMVQGPVIKRSGTLYKANAKYDDKKVVLIRFEFSTTQAYLIEFGDLYCRFYRDDGQITLTGTAISGATQANPVVVSATAHGLANGDRAAISGVVGMTQLNGREFIVANAAANTFELSGVNGAGYDAYTSGGTVAEIYEIVTPYLEADLPNLRFVQSADTLYIAHGSYAPRTLTRTGHTAWILSTISFFDGPYLLPNITDTTLTPSATTGSVTITASAVTGINGGIGFQTTDVGRIIRMKGPDGWTWATVTARASATSVTADIEGGPFGKTKVSKTVTWNSTQNAIYMHAKGLTATSANYVVKYGGTVQLPAAYTVTITHNKKGVTYVRIVLVTLPANGTVVSIDFIVDGGGTTEWSLGLWSDTTGYPAAVTFYEDRLFFAGSAADTQRFDGSRSGDYTNFQINDPDGLVTSSHSLSYTINASDVNAIRWLVDDEKGLIIGTEGKPWLVRPSANSEALSPTNIVAKPLRAIGCSNIPPVKAEGVALYVQRLARKLRELKYVFEVDGFRAPDVTVLASHITQSGIVRMALQTETVPVVWALLANGTLIGATYDPDQKVMGWHRHVIGGYSDAGQTLPAAVESIATLPSVDGTTDELWLLVRRYINGATRRTVERMAPFFEDTTAQVDAHFVDSGFVYSGGAASTLTGLYPLEGQIVTVLADGATHPDRTVTNGKITLDRTVTKAQIGLKYTGKLKTLVFDKGSQSGTSLGKIQRFSEVKIKLNRSLGLSAGPTFEDMQTVSFRTSAMDTAEAVELYTGDVAVDWWGDYEKGAHICIQHDQPLPSTILAIMPQVNTQDKG